MYLPLGIKWVYISLCHYFYKKKEGSILENSKILFGSIFINKEEIKECNNKYPIELEYYKICNKKSGIIQKEYEVYGVEIIKKEYIGGIIEKESSSIKNITKNEKTVNKLICLLKENEVTPITLNDVVEDFFY